jgi:hypothetical protein
VSDTPSSSPVAPRWHLPALLVGLALVLLAAFPYFEQVRNANEIPRLLQAMSLVEAGEWAIDSPSRRGIPTGPDVARSPVDQRLYPNKPPGASVVGAAGYALARLGDEPPTLREFTWWARLLAGVVPTLILAAFAWSRLRPFYPPLVCATAIVLVVLGTPLFAYSRLFYGHALAACLLYVGVVLLERGLVREELLGLALGGLASASAITVEYGAAFAGLPIAAVLLWPVVRPGVSSSARGKALLHALVALAGAVIPVAFLALYQRAVFGSPWATGYHYAADPSFAELHGQGLLGLGLPRWDNVVTHLLSLETGLLVWSPLVVFACIGLVRLSRHRGPNTRGARLRLAIFLVILLMGLGLSFEGGWRVGPRYLVVALPMLIMGVAEFITAWRDHPRFVASGLVLGLFNVAVVWSLLANSLAATLWPHIDPTNIAEPFGAVLLPLWTHGFAPYGFPSWVRGGSTLAIAVPVGVGVGLTMYSAARLRPQLILLPMLLGAGLGIVILVGIVPRSVVAHPLTERNLFYIEGVYEPRMREGKRTPGKTQVLAPLD